MRAFCRAEKQENTAIYFRFYELNWPINQKKHVQFPLNFAQVGAFALLLVFLSKAICVLRYFNFKG